MKRFTSFVLAALLWFGTVSYAFAAPDPASTPTPTEASTSTPTSTEASTSTPTSTETRTSTPAPTNVIDAPKVCDKGYKYYMGKCRRVL